MKRPKCQFENPDDAKFYVLSEAIRQIRDTEITSFLVASVKKIADGGSITEKGTIQYQDELKNIFENEEIVKK